MSVEPGVLRPCPIAWLSVAGERHESDAGTELLTNPLSDLIAVDIREADVHEHDVRGASHRRLDPFLAGRRFENLVPIQAEHRREHLSAIVVILDDEDASRL